MLTIIIFLLILSLLVVIHEFGHFIVAKLNNVYVEEFGFGLPPRLFGIKIGETLYSLNLLPFGGFVKVLGEEEIELTTKKIPDNLKHRTFTNKKPYQKIAIVIAGVICNFILGWLIISYLFTQGVPTLSKRVKIEKVIANTPASAAKLKQGMIIKNITYQNKNYPITDPDTLVKLSKKYAGKEINLTIDNNGQIYQVKTTPRVNPPKNQGSLGLAISNVEIEKYSIIEAPYRGLVESVNITVLTVRELSKLVFRLITLQKPQVEVAGPVGIVSLTKQAADVGYLALLQLIGLLSLNLAIINILPFPALDGGRLSMILYEVVSRRKINPTIERRLNVAGFAILISLIILITINDIIKLIR